MIETSPEPGAESLDNLPTPVLAPKRRWSPQLVWVVPIVAAFIGGWLAIKALRERGPTITIEFSTAEGLEAGKTHLKYKAVTVGEVTAITLGDDHKHVFVTAQLAKSAEKFLVEDTRFWVVRPRVAGGNVSGLSTLVSGAYVGVDIGKSEVPQRTFIGLETPPVVTSDLPGREFKLRAEDLGSLDIGSPVNYRRITVGEVVAFELNKDGSGVTLRVFVHAPYERYVTTNTRFWHASGLDVRLDAAGIKVDTESLATILLGGIAFQTPREERVSPPPSPDFQFDLAANQDEAMKTPERDALTFVLNFEESVRGLSIGAPVDFRGVVIGEVTAIDVGHDPESQEIELPVKIAFYPQRLRNRSRADKPNVRKLLNGMVERGFRAQLRTSNLVTGQLYIGLDFFPGVTKSSIDWMRDPIELPTIPGSLVQLQAMVVSIAEKLDKLPLNELSTDLRSTLTATKGSFQNLDSTLKATTGLVRRIDKDLAPAARDALVEARKTLDAATTSMQSTLGDDAPIKQDLREALHGLTRAAESLRVLADYLERHPEALLRGKPKDPP
jgi:paraquat-inducible protein B